ncbi:MAG: aspartate--tRNA(Asn) ligase [Thermofilaceae archaeon]
MQVHKSVVRGDNKMNSQNIKLSGWVNSIRAVGGIVFLEVIDGNSLNIYTVVAKKSKNLDIWQQASKVKIGSAITIKGTIPETQVSKRGLEIHATELKILTEPVDLLPLDPVGTTPALLDTVIEHRYVALRIARQRAVFRIRAIVASAAREYLESNGFLEIHTPKICGAGAEGGTTLFQLDYFGRKAFLSQSPQLYKQMLMCGVSRVYELAPYFRAEPHSTIRHLNESWGIDVEMGFIDGVEEVMGVLEELISHIFARVKEIASHELSMLGVELSELKRPFKRLDYSEALEILKSLGFKVEWGQDLGSVEEKTIGELMLKEGYNAYFIVNYPWDAKPFYIMRKGKLGIAFDLDYKGLELASGGQREHRYNELVENIRLKGLNPDDFSFYLKAFKYGMPPHGGFGLGLDRLVMVITQAQNIREVVLFPRDRQRLVP